MQETDPAKILAQIKERERSGLTAEEVDPNATSNGMREIAYFEHPDGEGGVIPYDVNTLEIQPFRTTRQVLRLPEPFLQVAQPYVNSCSEPSEKNRGCPAAAGCPYGRKKLWGTGWFNVIIQKGKSINSVPCDHYYFALRPDGLSGASVSYRAEGHQLLLDRTTIPSESYKFQWDQDQQRRVLIGGKIETEVDNLGPMYQKLIRERNGHNGKAEEGHEVRGQRDSRLPERRLEPSEGDGGVRDHVHGEGRGSGDGLVRQGSPGGKAKRRYTKRVHGPAPDVNP